MESNRTLQVVLYTRDGCHLCDDARALLDELGIIPNVINIDDNAELHQRFDTCVPVVEIDGRIRFRGRVEPRLLKRIIRNRE